MVKINSVTVPNNQKSCFFCNEPHYIAACNNFRSKSAKERLSFVETNKLCFNCLGRHRIENCKTQKTCSICHSKHHTTLHEILSQSQGNQSTSSSSNESQLPPPAVVTSKTTNNALVTINTANVNHNATVLLGTAIVLIESDSGKVSQARALIDPGSTVSLVSSSLVHRMKLSRDMVKIRITGINNHTSLTEGSTKFLLRSRIDHTSCYRVEAFILPQITSYVPRCQRVDPNWTHLSCLQLADPNFYSDEPIEILLGIDIYQLIAQGGVERNLPGDPVALRTSLGYILVCSSSIDAISNSTQHISLSLFNESYNSEKVSEIMQSFWEVESVPPPPSEVLMSSDDAKYLFSITFR